MGEDLNTVAIVAPSMPNVSNQARGLMFRERLDDILKTCDPAEVPAFKNRFSRKWFADRIGCSPSTLTTNPRLRKALGIWEEKNRKKMVNVASRREDDETNVVALPRRKSAGRIYRVPVTLMIGKNSSEKIVPTLVWEDGLDEWVGNYARHLTFRSPNGTSSVEETVKKLRDFRRFQREHGVRYEHVTDDFLIVFQGTMEARGRARAKRRDDLISAVHDFFKWADDHGLLVNHIQTRPKGEYNVPDDYQFPISSEWALVMGRHGKTYEKWVSTLTGGTSQSTYGLRHTPTSDEVLHLGEVVETHGRHRIRNKLIMDWALFTGARVSEIVQLMESDLPPFDDIQAFFEDDNTLKVFEVGIMRKNRGKSMLRVPGDLALRTAEYIAHDKQRAMIIARRDGGLRRNSSGPIFLSEKGGTFDTDSLSRIFRHFFKKAGIKKANIHRLRAKFITEMIEFQLDRYANGGIDVDPTSSWQETVLVSACQAMGHSHPISLQPYLNEILQKRMTKDGKIEPRSVEAREQSLKVLVETTKERLVHHPRLMALAGLIEKKEFDGALELVSDLHAQLKEMV
ncbi:MAG: site-specific integrase [Pseudorhizobium pelagicum]|uniref:tyrosine-type recombinase/integrase n=1 Tax=Pseudorhizobium pelagicum TaxID=1509405 RepID=UPI003460F6C7